MPKQISPLITQFSNGFLLGAAAVLSAGLLQPFSDLAWILRGDPLAMLFALIAAGSCFGMGSLATAMFFEDEDLDRERQ